MSIKQKALSGLLWTAVQQFSTQGISFAVSLILSRLLLPEEFGMIALLSVFMSLGIVLMESGLGQSLIRTTNPTIEDYSTVFYFNLAGSLIIYGIIYFCAPFIADFYNQNSLEKIVKWYGLIFISNALSSIHFTRLTKEMQFKKELTIIIPSLLMSSVIGVTMAYWGYGVWSLVVSALSQSIAVAFQMWIRSEWSPVLRFNKEKFKYHFLYGYKLTLSGMLDTLFSNAYVLIIGKFFAPVQVGFYNRADTLKQLPVSNISAILNKVTFPLFAEVKDDDVRLKEIYKKIMQMVMFFVAPILLIMSALAEPLFRFLFTDKWLPAVPYFQILCWAGIMYPIHAYNLNILKVKGRSDLFLKLEIIKKFLIVIVISVSFSHGIYGLLYGGVITTLLGFFINTYYTGKLINYSSWNQIVDLIPTLFLAFISGAAVYCIDWQMRHYLFSDFIRLLLGATTGALLFLLLSNSFRLQAVNELINIIKKDDQRH
jgi:teichuronic acid exporter